MSPEAAGIHYITLNEGAMSKRPDKKKRKVAGEKGDPQESEMKRMHGRRGEKEVRQWVKLCQ